MKGNRTARQWRTIIVAGAVILACIGMPATAWAKNSNPRVLPPNARPHGLTYGEWSAKWWQWAYSQPTSVNPLLDQTGEDCAQGQTGHVWFLAGALFDPFAEEPEEQIFTRHCTIPAGTALFFPVLNSVWLTFEGDEEACLAAGYPTLEACARDAISQFLEYSIAQAGSSESGLQVIVDNVPVDLKLTTQFTSPYRVQSPSFEVLLPMDNFAGITEENCPVVEGKLDCQPDYADGIYLMLTPLSAGSHTIRIVGGGYFDVTYQITVQPGRSRAANSVAASAVDAVQMQIFLPLVNR